MQMLDVIAWMLVFVRVSSYLIIFPLFSAQSIPTLVRLGLAALAAFLIVPFVTVEVDVQGSLFEFVTLLFIEVCTGLTLGLLARFIFYAIEIAGSLIATESGMMLSSNFNPVTSTFGSAPGALLHWLGVVLLLALNLHHWVIIGLQRSYEIIPPGGAQANILLLGEISAKASGMFVIALQMTAPILAASFVVTLVFSLLARAVPQMNVFAESFPVRSITGLIVFGFTCTLLAQHIVNHLQRIPEDFIRVAGILAG